MKKICIIITFIGLICSCNHSAQQKEKQDKQTDKDFAWLEYSQVGMTDSIKVTIHYSIDLDSLKSKNKIKDRWIRFLFTPYRLPSEEFKKIAFITDNKKFEKVISNMLLSTAWIDPDSTSHTFYLKIRESGVYHLSGMIDDNLFIKGKDKVRKIGTYITKDIKVK